jgi:hypothetical protein
MHYDHVAPVTKRLLYGGFGVVKVHKVVNVDTEPGLGGRRSEVRPRHHNHVVVTSVVLDRKCEVGKWVRRSAMIATERKGYCDAPIYWPCQCTKLLLANIANFDRISPASVFQCCRVSCHQNVRLLEAIGRLPFNSSAS